MSSNRSKPRIPAPKAPSAVTLALQLPQGERLVQDFDPGTTLWNVLLHFDKTQQLDPSLSSSQAHIPVCIYLRQEVAGRGNLESTTLQMLGINGGKVAIRYLLKASDSPREQAHVGGVLLPPPRQPSPEAYRRPLRVQTCSLEPMAVDEKPQEDKEEKLQSHPFSEDLGTATITEKAETSKKVDSFKAEPMDSSAGSSRAGSAGQPIAPQRERSLNVAGSSVEKSSNERISANMMIKRARLEVDERRIPLNERGDLIYSLEDVSLSADIKPAESDLADDFFELTVDDLRSLLQDLKKQYAVTENPLLTAEMRRSREERRFQDILERYPVTVLRIQFHDRLVLQIPFHSETTIAAVKEAVRQYLEGDIELNDFYLYTAPPKKHLDLNVTLLRSGLTPSAVIYISSEAVHCKLQEQFKTKLSSYFGAMLDANERLSIDERIKTSAVSRETKLDGFEFQATNQNRSDGFEETGEQEGPRVVPSSGPVPKWFKMKK